MMKLKTILNEIDSDSFYEREVQKFESHIQKKYESVLKTFMVYYNKFKKCLELTDIYLKPEFYGKGFGSKIMEELVEFADKINLPIILIPENERGSNKKLISFYEKFGFKLNIGRNKNFLLNIPYSKSMLRLPKGNK